jgi:hypothetical protein
MLPMDTDVSNYTLSELMAIIEINDINDDEIKSKTNKLINRFKNSNPKLSVFFRDVQSQLLQYSSGLKVPHRDNTQNKIIVEGYEGLSNDAIYPSGNTQQRHWYEDEALTQNDKNQNDKITDRKQKIDIFNNQYVPMNREQIATTDTFQVPVKQDSLNPNLKNTIHRFINLDSQFRQYTSGVDSLSTDYTLDLCDTLKNAISLRVYSYQIPYTWYTIDRAYGNTCFWILNRTETGYDKISIYIPSGNYSPAEFVTALRDSFNIAGFSNYPVDGPVIYNPINGLITISIYNADFSGYVITTDNSLNEIESIYTSFKVSINTIIFFFDFTGVLQCNNNCLSKSNHYFNNTLGWLMGYRLPYYNVEVTGNTAPSILNLTGTKYLMLLIDDYNQNHVNDTIVSISQFTNTLKMPEYYSPDLPYTCLTPAQKGNNLIEIVNQVKLDSLIDSQTINASNGLLIAGKYKQDYSKQQIVLPSAPRTLTNAQLYTINQTSGNKNNLTNYIAKAPTASDILAILPIKPANSIGNLIVEFSGSLQDNNRTYFGPVNIERMAVKLMDDKGNLLNLNGNDWCVTLICECLYQY